MPSSSKMVFTATIKKFGVHGEKTGWSYIDIPQKIATQLLPGNKKSFRVKGKIDEHQINRVALVPIGEGDFIMALNATMRKAIRKQKGDTVELKIEVDKSEQKISEDFIACLNDDPAAMDFFSKMPPGHQRYYSNWIDSAKTEATKIKRIALAVSTLAKRMNYGEMIRSQKKGK